MRRHNINLALLSILGENPNALKTGRKPFAAFSILHSGEKLYDNLSLYKISC